MKPEVDKPARILLVDDDNALRAEFKECFEEYGIAEASCGDEALQYLKRPNEIDLVMLDVRMPGSSGMDVLERIKEVSPGVKVVIFTGYGSKDTAVNALRSRADDYIEKPLDIGDTHKVIGRHLGAGGRRANTPGTEDKLNRVKEFITRNCHKKVTLVDAASAVNMSPKYLSRVFKEREDVGFNDFKLSLKMKRAKDCLEKTRDTVEQISYGLGYLNSESFIRLFKKLTGLTPTEFRRNNQSKK